MGIRDTELSDLMSAISNINGGLIRGLSSGSSGSSSSITGTKGVGASFDRDSFSVSGSGLRSLGDSFRRSAIRIGDAASQVNLVEDSLSQLLEKTETLLSLATRAADASTSGAERLRLNSEFQATADEAREIIDENEARGTDLTDTDDLGALLEQAGIDTNATTTLAQTFDEISGGIGIEEIASQPLSVHTGETFEVTVLEDQQQTVQNSYQVSNETLVGGTGVPFAEFTTSNGAQTVFASDGNYGGGGGRIGLVEATGQGTITDTLAASADRTVYGVSADGRYALFSSREDLVGQNGSGNAQIYRVDLQTNTYFQVTNFSGENILNADINSDGSQVALFSTADLAGGNADGNAELFTISVGSSTYFQQTNTTAANGAFDTTLLEFSNEQIAFAGNSREYGGDGVGFGDDLFYVQQGSTSVARVNVANDVTAIAINSSDDLILVTDDQGGGGGTVYGVAVGTTVLSGALANTSNNDELDITSTGGDFIVQNGTNANVIDLSGGLGSPTLERTFNLGNAAIDNLIITDDALGVGYVNSFSGEFFTIFETTQTIQVPVQETRVTPLSTPLAGTDGFNQDITTRSGALIAVDTLTQLKDEIENDLSKIQDIRQELSGALELALQGARSFDNAASSANTLGNPEEIAREIVDAIRRGTGDVSLAHGNLDTILADELLGE